MEDGLRPEKSTGYTLHIKTENESELPPVKSTVEKSASPVLTTVPMKDEFLISDKEVLASNLLAVQIMMGDFKELKVQLPGSWQASSNGKIYWCADFTGHELTIVNGLLYVDGVSSSRLLIKLLKETT